MIGLGNLMAAAFGMGTYVDGLACTPVGLTVNIAPGRIIALSTVDNSAYGSIPASTAALVKMGINLATINYNLASYVPGTSGWSVNLLFEAQLAEVDGTAIVLPYYNASNPASPYSGPNNSGAAQNTVRAQSVSIQIKAGTGAPSGTQPTPSVDAGWAALYVVTLTQGVGTISAGNILTAPSAPFVGTKLGQLPIKLTSNLSLYVQTPANGGSDTTNNGLGVNVAFATIQAAFNALNNYNINGFGVTINVGAGTFAGASTTGLFTGQTATINIVGAGASSTTIAGGTSPALQVFLGGNIGISNATITGSSGLSSNSSSNISINSGVITGASSGAKLFASGGIITVGSSYSDSGNAVYHSQSILGGTVNVFGAITVTEVGTPAYSGAYVAVTGGQWSSQLGSVSFAGSGATGNKFVVSGGGLINTNGQATSFFPGSVTPALPQGTSPPTGFYI